MGELVKRAMAAMLLLALGSAACSGDDDDAASRTGAQSETTTTEAEAEAGDEVVPGAEWEISDPEAEGMDAAKLEEARDYAFGEGMNTQGVVVVHDGAIAAEWYADGANEDSWAASWSVAKSWTSALVGIALEEGLIPSVDEPMTTYYPDWAGTPKEEITLRHVLQMSSGLDWDEQYSPEAIDESEIIQMVLYQADELTYAAGRPSDVEPGTHWSYSSGDTMLLSGVIEQATGMPVHEYARAKLFDPIEVEQADWWRDAEDHTLTYCCLDTTSRGFARFGLLYLRGGEWGDEQVVPAQWVEDSLAPAPTADHYGYQWWLGSDAEGLPEDLFAARGHDGQYIYVIPSLDLVVVRNGTYVKDPGEAVADPNLFGKYPSDGLGDGRGTVPPADWDETEFLGPIVESLQNP